jgi:xanthine dehydrogenase YagS FAD-binding subunit
MSAAADHPEIVKTYPVISQSLKLAASAQLRNMATLGGNVLQRTRCPYFRVRPGPHATNAILVRAAPHWTV